MSPSEILIKLFDEVSKQLHIAQLSIPKKDFSKANDSLCKSREIIETISYSLDMNMPISENLRQMYNFISSQILQANVKKDTQIIDSILPLVKDLRDSFCEAQKTSRLEQQNAVRRSL